MSADSLNNRMLFHPEGTDDTVKDTTTSLLDFNDISKTVIVFSSRKLSGKNPERKPSRESRGNVVYKYKIG